MAARTHAKVLILGETGVGKEVVARLIHAQSARAPRTFVAVNCSGLPETLLESELFGHMKGSFTGAHRDKLGLIAQADRGTLFLDELGEMSLRMQAMLLRFTETGEVQRVGSEAPAARSDVRLIAATNRDLRASIEEGAFRQDLYYRLNVIQIRIPALRDRADDIPLLLDYYLGQAAQTYGLRVPTLAASAQQVLRGYHWPGNVRELRNVTERLALQGVDRPIVADDLPQEVLGPRVMPGAQTPAPAVVATVTSPGTPAPQPPPLQPPMPMHPHRQIPRETTSAVVEKLWDRLMAGEDFWAVVHAGFKQRELTKADLTALVDRGLRETYGSYRALLRVFNLPHSDYKRLHAFLYQQQCNLPVQPYRQMRGRARTETQGAGSAETFPRELTA